MSSRVLIAVCFIVIGTPVFTYAQDGPDPVLATDLLKIRKLGGVTVSPDGRQVLYTIETVESRAAEDEDEYEYRTHIHLVSADGGSRPQQLTYGKLGASEPTWHPDGDRIAFVRSVDGKPQIFILPLSGGEAFQLTHFDHGASAPKWSPDGSRLLFATSVLEGTDDVQNIGSPPWSDERPGRHRDSGTRAQPDPDGTMAEIRAWLDRNARKKSPRVFSRLNIQGEHDLEPFYRFRQLFVMDLDEPESPPRPVTRSFFSAGGAEWLPDGERIVVSGAPLGDLHPDRVRDSNLYLVDADGRDLRLLLDLSLDGVEYAVHEPRISPDGQSIAFIARDLADQGYASSHIGVMSLKDGEAELLTQAFDRSAGDIRWSNDGWFLYFVAPSEGDFPLFRVPAYHAAPPPSVATADTLEAAVDPDPGLIGGEEFQEITAADEDTPLSAADEDTLLTAADADTLEFTAIPVPAALRVERLTAAGRGVRSYDVGRENVFLIVTDPENPYELYASGPPFETERRLTDHNASWLASKRLSQPEAFAVERDSLIVPYWVMKPAFFEEGRSYPLLLQMHGGPSAMWGPGEASMWHEFQFFASRGYGIVFSNPRGSGGYGYDFQRANYQDWGSGPAADVLAAASEAAEMPWVDPARQAITGGSYAGYLTAWIIAHDDRFRAAVAQRGVYDLHTFLGEGNAWRLVPSHFGGYPWDDTVVSADTLSATVRELLVRNSPITYVDGIRTPLLIIHGDNDLRTGVSQSEMLYKSLKILGRPVEYVRYPGAGHDLSRTGDPRHRIDRLLRIYEFMERFAE